MTSPSALENSWVRWGTVKIRENRTESSRGRAPTLHHRLTGPLPTFRSSALSPPGGRLKGGNLFRRASPLNQRHTRASADRPRSYLTASPSARSLRLDNPPNLAKMEAIF